MVENGPITGQSATPHFFAERLRGGLQPRVLVPPRISGGPYWMLLHLLNGEAEILSPEGPQPVSSQSVLTMPMDEAPRVRLAPGFEGVRIYATESGLSATIGTRPQSAELRLLCDQTYTLSLDEAGPLNARIRDALEIMINEYETRSPGHQTIIETKLRYVLLLIWREAFVGSDAIEQTPLLGRFRHLVETNFRKRWKIADYADELGTTPDQLHHITTNALGRTPSTLIRDRSAFEAKALLAQSSLSLGQIAVSLGFSSTEHFSKFFKQTAGMPPGQFRKEHAEGNQDVEAFQLEDWP
ncbi:MAG: helix-turn-helix transcriptional regulator [Pseudomonadota bacterium]